MTASPHRVRSQNTENTPNSGRLAPSSGPSRVDVAHLRSLPPTLFRLRNLNAPKPVTVAPVASEAASRSMLSTNQASESFQAALVSTASKSEPNPQKELRDPADSESTQGSLVSRLSSQSIVLFLILAIAVMGIVIGNRGGEDGTDTTSPLKETLLADNTAPRESGVLTENARDVAAIASESANDQTLPPTSTTTKHADLAAKPSESSKVKDQAKPTSQTPGSEVVADVQDPDASDATDMFDLEQPAQTSIESASSPRNGTQDGLASESVQKAIDPKTSEEVNKSNASVAMLGMPASVEPSVDHGAANVAVSPSSRTPSSTASTSGYTQTQTPSGISDWLSYLPSVDGAIEEPGTLAVSETPQSPIASYQQYLDSLTPSDSSTTTPVGYLQESDSGSPYTANGMQAQLPVPSNTTQRR